MTSLEYCTAVLGDKNIILDEVPKNGTGEGVVRGVSPLYLIPPPVRARGGLPERICKGFKSKVHAHRALEGARELRNDHSNIKGGFIYKHIYMH